MSKSTLLRTVFLCIFASLVFILVKRYSENQKDAHLGARHGCLPPPELPSQWPLGIDWIRKLWRSDAERHLLAFLCSIADGYEPHNMLSQHLIFAPRAYCILDPRNLEAIQSTSLQDCDFGVRHGVLTPLLGHGIFTQEGAGLKRSRKLLRKQFNRTQCQNFDTLREHVDHLLACLSGSQAVVDLQPLSFKLTLGTTTALLLGRSVYSLKGEQVPDTNIRDFAENFDIAQVGLAKRFRLAPWHFFCSPPRFRRACTAVHSFVDDLIRIRDLDRGKDCLPSDSDSFLDQSAQDSGGPAMLHDQPLNILLAGRDFTACCISWTIRLLVRHERVLERLQKEIRSALPSDEHLTCEHIRQMSHLALVIKESLRLFPPVPLNNRTATRTMVLPRGGGPDGTAPILMRRGELVVDSQYVNARRKNVYGPDAEELRPERWEGNQTNPFGWAYFPFNRGPRACLGQDFALMEVSYTILRLLQAFEIKLPAGEAAKNEKTGGERQRLTLVLSRADGCKVELREVTDR